MRVDSHHHVWDLSVRDQPWTAQLPTVRRTFTVDELRPSLRRHGIDATVVIQTVCVPAETPELLARLQGSRGGELLVGIRHLSGLTSEAPADWTPPLLEPFVDALLSRFGPDRLIYGSDWPVCLLGGGYDVTIGATEALTAQLSAAEREQLFGDVAARRYGLAR